MISTRALLLATVAGTILQIAMVVAGHTNKSIADMFAIGGMTISLLAGLAYALIARDPTLAGAALGGLAAGGICALIGIAISYMLGDVTASILVLGTLSSAVTGAIGGLIGRLLARLVAT